MAGIFFPKGPRSKSSGRLAAAKDRLQYSITPLLLLPPMFDLDSTSALRPEPDRLLQHIADYVFAVDRITGEEAIDTARLCLMDTLDCGLLALNYPACTKLLGPVVAGATMPGSGARVPGTSYELDPTRGNVRSETACRSFFADGTGTERSVVDYPIGQRRAEGIPVLLEKFERNLRGRISPRKANAILELCGDRKRLQSTPVHRFMDLFVV